MWLGEYAGVEHPDGELRLHLAASGSFRLWLAVWDPVVGVVAGNRELSGRWQLTADGMELVTPVRRIGYHIDEEHGGALVWRRSSWPTFADGFTLSVRGDASFSDRYYSTSDLSPQGVVDAVTFYGGRVALNGPDGSWQVALSGENLTNEKVFRTKFPQILDTAFGVRNPASGYTLMRGFMGTPRTWRISASKTF